MKHYVEIEQLLESGAHFGHLTRRWNPKMEQFIFMERNGIHILDLRKSQILINIARNAIFNIASKGKLILFVGTKFQSKTSIEEKAKSCNMYYVIERWLGGMLTNFSTIRKSIKKLEGIDKMEVDGTFEKITKKERLMLTRKRDKLRVFFGGIEDMTRLPGALFVVDTKKEHIAIKEAKILGIPVIALVDTNCDPEDVDYPIPCNDDSTKAIDLVTKIIADAVNEGNAIASARKSEMKAESERISKEKDKARSTEQPKVQRRMRERKGKAPGQFNKENTSQKKQTSSPEKNNQESKVVDVKANEDSKK